MGSTTATVTFAKTLRLTTFPIPLMVEGDKKGIFIDLTNEIAKRNNIKIAIDVIPTGKSLLAFSSGRADGFFPGLDVYMPRKTSRTLAFYQKADFVFYKKGKVLSKISDLEGKKVGLTFRYPYAKELMDNKKIRFEFAEDDIANMRKLGQGLIEAFVVEERSGLKALELSGVRDVGYQAGKPLSVQEVYYAFQDSEEGRKYADIFSKTLTKMKNDGHFEKIMFNRQSEPSP
ncbi:transporter substrate-binding domain-containing protein [Bdellovibrio sp. PAP01]|uniref:Transporter substrate-binding domain-containing protein n=1 Tax=Bdellovibrio svalbardensis TaxID=2972972 RepID=A0ABT6DJF6_9BACT|nr:transporter substrate-binding domain-containing protein [Bdellovibrio svalbardensis]